MFRLKRVSLSAKEVTHPQNGWHALMHTNHLRLGGVCDVDVLSFCWSIDQAFPRGFVGTSVASHIVVNSECCADEVIILVQVGGLNCKTQELGSAHILGNSGEFLIITLICFVFSDLLGQE